MIKELFVLGAFCWAMLFFQLLWNRRKREIVEFDSQCRELLWNKSKYTDPWRVRLGMSVQEYYKMQIQRYEESRPSERRMLSSLKKLTIQNWFSLYDQGLLFDLPFILDSQKNVREILADPELKSGFNGLRGIKLERLFRLIYSKNNPLIIRREMVEQLTLISLASPFGFRMSQDNDEIAISWNQDDDVRLNRLIGFCQDQKLGYTVSGNDKKFIIQSPVNTIGEHGKRS